MQELLVIVDKYDKEIGVRDKLGVHKTGVLHRAFSLFIFNSKNELLLQQRADNKYHSGGLWSNTCCSHPRSGEKISDAIKRRLDEEMQMHCDPEFKFSFIYNVDFENGLSEHEFDHVYFGYSDEIPEPDTSEVKAWKYVTLRQLQKEIADNPDDFSAWIKLSLPLVREHFHKDLLQIF